MGKIVDTSFKMFDNVFNLKPSNATDLFKQTLQYKIDDTFELASDINTIQEEQTNGKLDWQDVEVRITHIINADTGEKLGDDWRNLIFKSIDHAYGLGKKYKFNDNIWLTTNTDLYKYVTSSTIVRRCNNAMYFYDANHNIISEPCIIDYKPTNIAVSTDKDTVNTQETKIEVTVQYNNNTKNINLNDRFIFGKNVYRVIYQKDYQLTNTMDLNSCPLIMFRMQITQKKIGFDDFEKCIAWNDNNINPNPFPIPIGTSYIITSSDNSTTQDQTNTKLYYSTLLLGSDNIQTYGIYAWKDKIQQSDTFNIVIDSTCGVPINYYTFTIIDGNTFKIQNNKMYLDNKLKVLCTDSVTGDVVELDVLLGGEFG